VESGGSCFTVGGDGCSMVWGLLDSEQYTNSTHLMFQMKEHKAMISDAVAGNQAFPNAKAHWVNNVKLFMESQVQQPVQSTLSSWISTQHADSVSSAEDEKKVSSSEEDEADAYEIDLSLV